MQLQMVDLKTQYQRIKGEIDTAVLEVFRNADFINGGKVRAFQTDLEQYLQVNHVIPCANGTDALQIAMMALDLQPNDEVIVPSFTFVATAEVIALLQLKPIMIDVDRHTMNCTAELIEKAITPRTKAIVPVHLFGQCCDMEAIMQVAEKHNLYVIEDNAQAIGADYTFSNGKSQKAGTIGHIGCTSFFPSKNLGCYGDGGALFTNDTTLAEKIRTIANHGQSRRYYHDMIGVNSRLDTIQAAILQIKLKYLDEYNKARNEVANRYDSAFKNIIDIVIPARETKSTHVFHQYTLQIKHGKRDALKAHLDANNIPCMIYYPVPMYKQEAFKNYWENGSTLNTTEYLCSSVLSLPIHTEMSEEAQNIIIKNVLNFFE